MATAAYWDRHGFPDGTTVQATTDFHALIEAVCSASLDNSHVHKLMNADFSAYFDRGPVFEPLREPEFFHRARIRGGTISWPELTSHVYTR